MSAAPKQSTKKSKSPADFLKERPSDKSEQISGKEIWKAATLKNETTRKVVGFLMLVLSVIFLISFVSFFFTWQTDQSFSADGGAQYDGETKLKAANAMGAIGSSLAFFFMHNGFGLGAFAILPYMVLAGMYLLFDYRPFSLLRILLHTILFVIWFSLFLGYCFQIWFPLLGGTFGYFGIIQIQNSIGPIGSFLFLTAFAVVYSFVFLNLNPFSRIVLKNPEDIEEHELDEVLDISSNGIQAEKIAPSIVVDGADDDEIFVSSDSEELKNPFADDNLDDGPSVSDFENWDGMNITMKCKDEQVEPSSLNNNEALNGTTNKPKFEPIVDSTEPEEYQFKAENNDGSHEESEEFVIYTSESEERHEPTVISAIGPNEIKFEDGFAIQDLTQQKDELVTENKGDAAVERYGVDTEFDPKADLSKYQFPTLDLLKDYDKGMKLIASLQKKLETAKNSVKKVAS